MTALTADLLPALERARRCAAPVPELEQLRELGLVDETNLLTTAGMRSLRRLRRPPCKLPPVSRDDLDFYADREELRRFSEARHCLKFHTRRCRCQTRSEDR